MLRNNLFILGFDFGIRYLGVAVGQFLTRTSSPLCSILLNNLNFKYAEIYSLLHFWNPKFIIIGYPISEFYDNSILLNKIDFFVFKLRRINFYNIFFINENLSSWQARRMSIFNFKSCKDFYYINALSASVLLDQWFLEN